MHHVRAFVKACFVTEGITAAITMTRTIVVSFTLLLWLWFSARSTIAIWLAYIYHDLYGSTSCYISHCRKWQFSTPHISKTVQPILTKLETYNYLPKTTRHARPHIAASTWVVWANTQFATVSFFPCLFSFFFDFFVSRTDRTRRPICTKIGIYVWFRPSKCLLGVSMMTNHV